MDAKERHELKDNDLAEFIDHFGEFWSRHGNAVMVAVILVMLVWFGFGYYNNNNAANHENAWADLSSTTTPQGFRERAVESAGYPAVPQLALLRGAETYHQQAIQLTQEADGTKDDGMMSAEESLQAAESMFNQVLNSDADPAFLANAAVGLANLAETRHDFEAAAEHWSNAKQIADDARLSTIATLAQLRIDMLDDLARPIVFGESVETTEPVEPTTDDTPTDSTDPSAADDVTADTTETTAQDVQATEFQEAADLAEPTTATPGQSPGQ
jgi:predicted negative regulator of RcsB-dependent stress response